MKAGVQIAATLLIAVVLPVMVPGQQRPERVTGNDTNRITGIDLGPNGKVQITFKGGKYIEPPGMKEQTACENLQISEDGRAAGWLVATGNHGASYPIPTSLIVYRPGKPIKNFGNGLMLIDWEFVDDDRHVEFSSSQTHGPGANWLTMEVHDIETGQLLKRWQEPSDDTVRRDATLAELKGRVTNAPGSPVPDAFVTVRTRPVAEPLAATTTDESGMFNIPNLQPGQYELHVEHRGFKRRVIRITVGPTGDIVDIGTVTLGKQAAVPK
jgi:hypothetical protein